MPNHALLVGCNYPGTNNALRGCINDVWSMKSVLTTYCGFVDSDIQILIDTDDKYTKPTGAAIKQHLAELVAKAQDGDTLFFHYSGHGTQVPDASGGDEQDKKDEAICPCDMNLICDDDFRQILKPLEAKPNVKLTFIADCCHSGSLIDHTVVQIQGSKDGNVPVLGEGLLGTFLSQLGNPAGRDFKNRALPFNELCNMLSSMLGGKEVNATNIRGQMSGLFGKDASAKIQTVMHIAQTVLNATGHGSATKTGLMGKLFSCLGSSSAPDAPTQQAAEADAVQTQHATETHTNLLSKDVGILITGCQANETSADACPSGDPAKAHGALSNAIQTVVTEHHAQRPGVPITYRNLVVGVRELLAKTGFSQNPCLECSEENADQPFIVHHGASAAVATPGVAAPVAPATAVV